MANIYTKIEFDDLTDDLQDLAAIIGIENVRKLMETNSGAQFYIPKITRLDTFIRKYLEENKKRDSKELAKELSCSVQFVRLKMKQFKSLAKG
jgi:Mor family transcriptional regulator